MQRNKSINKIGTVCNDEEKNAMDIFFTLSTMNIKRIGKFFNSVKRCGVNVSDILLLLLLMPFYQIKTVSSMVKSNLIQKHGFECSSSVFYDLKNNPKINWRSLLFLVASRFRNLAAELNPELPNITRAFIIDDSPLPKTSHKTELVSRVHDHVSGDFILGYKILVLGYWDGLSFYPLDFSIHREKGSQIDTVKRSLETANKRLQKQRRIVKDLEHQLNQAQKELKATKKQNKGKQTQSAIKQVKQARDKFSRAKQKVQQAKSKYIELENKAIELRQELQQAKKKFPEYGLTKKQKGEQFRKQRDEQTPGAKRALEADIKKTTSLMNMLKGALKRGFRADYLLCDSWFCNQELIKFISGIQKKYNINLLTMAKLGTTKYQLLSNDRSYNAHELLTIYERKAVRARSHKSKYIKVPVACGGIRINLFFVKMGRCNSWKLLITTDLKMNFQKLMNTYQIRWSIEIFFRESKQYLNLGKSKSTCFDAQIADATISMVQYIILSFHRRITDYGSFEGAYASALAEAMQESIANELQKMFHVVLEMFCDYAGLDMIEFLRSCFRDEQNRIKLHQLNPAIFEKLQKQRAA